MLPIVAHLRRLPSLPDVKWSSAPGPWSAATGAGDRAAEAGAHRSRARRGWTSSAQLALAGLDLGTAERPKSTTAAEETTLPRALVHGEAGAARVVALCQRARAAGLREGQSLSEARARVPSLLTAPFDPQRMKIIETRIIEALLTVSPRLGRTGALALIEEEDGDFLLDVQSRDDVATLCTTMAELDLGPVAIGVADGAFAAFCAAKLATPSETAPRAKMVPRGGDAAFLAPLEASLLPTTPSSDASVAPMAASLTALGLTTLGQVAELPLEGMQARFGEEGRRMVGLARGQSVPVLSTFVPDEEPAVEVDLSSLTIASGGSIDAGSEGAYTLDAVLFALRAACTRLIPPLAARGIGIGEVELRLDDPKGRPTRLMVRPARPEIDALALFELSRATLAGAVEVNMGPRDEHAPRRDSIEIVSKLRLTVTLPVSISVNAERLAFARREAALLPLDVTLARLRGRFGTNNVVTPVRREDPRPEERGAFRAAHAVANESSAVPRDPALGPVFERATGEAPLPALRERLRSPSATIGAVILSRLPAEGDAWPVRGATMRATGKPQPPRRVAAIEPAERVASGWWSEPYELVYHWLVANDGTRALFSRGRADGGYRLVGVAD
jgi:hypothetical protein